MVSFYGCSLTFSVISIKSERPDIAPTNRPPILHRLVLLENTSVQHEGVNLKRGTSGEDTLVPNICNLQMCALRRGCCLGTLETVPNNVCCHCIQSFAEPLWVVSLVNQKIKSAGRPSILPTKEDIMTLFTSPCSGHWCK